MMLIIIVNTNSGFAAGNLQKTEAQNYTDHITFVLESKEVYHNKELFLSNNPNTVRDGVTYISLRTFSERLGLSVQYDSKTKESQISNGYIKLQFKVNDAQYRVNQKLVTSTHGVPFIENGTTMIPLRVFATHFDMKVVPELEKKSIHLYWGQKAVAKFEVVPKRIYAGQTKVTYIDQYQHPLNLDIKRELWRWNKEVFPKAGVYRVRRIVMDENGDWSQPYEVVVNVLPPNQAPVAKFNTTKDRYSIGEPITYIDQSTDDENAIVKKTWTNKETAFFSAGEREITLEVEDQNGLTSTYTKQIYIENDILYAKEEFDPWFTPIGEKYFYFGKNIISNPVIKYDIENQNHTLYRSNSPESIREEGIYYRDNIEGKVRVMVHQQNHRSNPVNLYLVATNMNEEPVEIKMPHVGMGGPYELVTTTGKLGLARYLQSLTKPSQTSMILKPGESKVILTELSDKKILKEQTLSAYADLEVSLPIQLQTVIIDSGKDVMQQLPTLAELAKDNVHTRGTFSFGNRTITIKELVGEDTKRIVFGDATEDTRVSGVDGMTGEAVLNQGNFGVLYNVKLERVAPRSVIVLNARGGHYSGAFLVNNQVVKVTEETYLKDSKEVAVLYRTGDVEEEVEIVFIPASGSNLPINIVVQPLPEKRH